ncbi:glyoxylate/succinic semialdehyde reductase 1-like [Camellia sinensis]|uniref:glyoxylate/succinic semialdehyde reductase 1-like n=1 Tax=Camellia sinensis TaxID=4442 RepID=UPI0010360075|nr:glyoxylate/succinic semialdehyde reductase 1-like [Camellia sinensis]
MKLAGSMMNAFSEGLILADKSGLNPKTLLDVLDLGAIANPMFKMKGPTMNQKSYSPAFSLKHQQKDMRLALAFGDQNAVSMPVAVAANEEHQGKHTLQFDKRSREHKNPWFYY